MCCHSGMTLLPHHTPEAKLRRPWPCNLVDSGTICGPQKDSTSISIALAIQLTSDAARPLIVHSPPSQRRCITSLLLQEKTELMRRLYEDPKISLREWRDARPRPDFAPSKPLEPSANLSLPGATNSQTTPRDRDLLQRAKQSFGSLEARAKERIRIVSF